MQKKKGKRKNGEVKMPSSRERWQEVTNKEFIYIYYNFLFYAFCALTAAYQKKMRKMKEKMAKKGLSEQEKMRKTH